MSMPRKTPRNSQSLLTVQLSNFELNTNALTPRESTEMVQKVQESSFEILEEKRKKSPGNEVTGPRWTHQDVKATQSLSWRKNTVAHFSHASSPTQEPPQTRPVFLIHRAGCQNIPRLSFTVLNILLKFKIITYDGIICVWLVSSMCESLTGALAAPQAQLRVGKYTSSFDSARWKDSLTNHSLTFRTCADTPVLTNPWSPCWPSQKLAKNKLWMKKRIRIKKICTEMSGIIIKKRKQNCYLCFYGLH